MTCIAGLIDDGKVYIGGDSAGVDERWNLMVRADEKVFKVGPFVMGFTSSFRMGQLIRYALPTSVILDVEQADDMPRFMSTKFIDALRKCLADGGFAKKEHNVESGGTFLVGIKGRLFEVDTDFQVGESVDGIAACGAGAQIALGSLAAQAEIFSRRGQKWHASETLRLALSIAERYSAAVRAPFRIMSTEDAA